MKKNNKITIASGIGILILAIFFVQLVISLSFTTAPKINDNLATYTTDNLVCEWGSSVDANSTVNVTWFLNNAEQFVFTLEDTSHTLMSGNTSKSQTWKCQVTIWNETNVVMQNASVLIQNSQPTNIQLYQSGVIVNNLHELFEDEQQTFIVNATDADNDVLTYSAPSGIGLCTITDPNTGALTCTANHQIITGFQQPSPESQNISTEQFIAGDGTAFGGIYFNFSLIPYNDQAVFKQNITLSRVIAGNSYQLRLNATDEELDYPLVFTLWTNLTDPEILNISNYNATMATITFDLPGNAPTNDYEGNWSVSVNVTDDSLSNSSRPPAQMNFTLEIIKTNDAPYFISNFTPSDGTQNSLFESYIYAQDLNSGDVLNFSISNASAPNQACNLTFPWSIQTLDGNYSNASALINVTLNNTHVACRYANVTIRDNLGGESSMLVFFNITNVNDELKAYNISQNGNISEQSIYLYQYYSYQINASDIDSYTYDAQNTGTLNYSLNDTSIFNVSSSGIITGNPDNDSEVGNHSILVTITDNYVPKYLIFNIEIINNNPPELNISNNYTLYQNTTLYLDFNSIDEDNHTMNLNFTSLTNYNGSNYSIYSIVNETILDDMITTWRLNISRNTNLLANSMVGYHSIQINISDELGSSQLGISTGIMNITILNVNDEPSFNSASFSPYVNRAYTTTINATDYDFSVPAGFANESLQFVIIAKSADINIINFTNVTGTNGSSLLSFTGTSVGLNRFITFAVYDNYGANDTLNVTFEVKETTSPPEIHSIKPFFNTTANRTEYEFAPSNLFLGNKVNINFTENMTIVFDVIASNDTLHPSGINYLNYYWYVGNESVESIINASPGVNSNLTYEFDFTSNGTYNVTLQLIDYHESSTNWTWILNVSNVNRPPFLQGYLDNLTGENSIDGTISILDFFTPTNSTGFFDYDTDVDANLTFSVLNPEGCSYVTFTVIGKNLRIAPLFTGYCVITFRATDKSGANATSNEVHIEITGVTEPQQSTNSGESSGSSDTRTRVVTIPFEEEVEVPSPIKLIAPGQVDTYVNKTITIPITIRNTWTEEVRGVTLSGVSLNATFYNDANATLAFEQEYYPSIPINGEYTTMLTISNYRTEGPFEIVVYGSVKEPEFTDSVSILINSLEQTSSGDAVRSKVTFAKDMISENPECRELNDLLIRADAAIESLDYREALNLVNAVINGCKYLVNKNEEVRQESPSLVEVSFDFVSENAENIVIVAAMLTLITVLAYTISGIKKMIQEKQ